MACKEFYTIALYHSHQYIPGRFRWVDCQLKYLVDFNQADIERALETLPDTLDETYERTLGEIKEAKWKYAWRLLLCIAVASRPLRVEELAEVLAFDFDVGPIPKFREDTRLQNPVQAVLSTCSTLVSVVKVGNSQVVQFAHFTVKEFLTLDRLVKKDDDISRYRISMIDAHTLVARACLGILLHLDKDITRDGLKNFPLAGYAAEHWLEHARFEGVSQNVAEGMQQLFDRTKHHLKVWLWMYDPTLPSWGQGKSAKVPSCETPLYYATFCGLQDVVEFLAIEYPQDVNSRTFDKESTPLLLASHRGDLKLAGVLVKHGADVAALTRDEETPLHLASQHNHAELARLLLEHRADVAAQTKDGETPLHLASQQNHVELARLLLEHHADVAAQTKDGVTPLHLASQQNHVELSRLLLEHRAVVAAQTKDGETPLHWASHRGHVRLAQLLFEHGANVAAQTKDGETSLHLASDSDHVELARVLIEEHGADVAAQTMDGETPLHWASHRGHVEVARLLIEHGADVAAQTKDRETPLHWASDWGDVILARLLLEHGADATAQAKDGETPLQRASYWGHAELMQVLSADVAAQVIPQIQQPAPI
jgi:ankyrin repeat protein